MSYLASRTREAMNVPSVSTLATENLPYYFDYSSLKDRELEKWLKNCTADIRNRNCKVIIESAEIGRILIDAKQRLPHGQFQLWVHSEFIQTGFFERSTAENYIKLKNAIAEYGIENLAKFSMSALYSLFTRATPQELKDHIVNKVAPSVSKVTRELVKKEKEKFSLVQSLDVEDSVKENILSATSITPEVLEAVAELPSDVLDSTLGKLLYVPEETKNFAEILETKAVESVNFYSVVLLQHSLNREVTEVDSVQISIDKYSACTDTIVLITTPVDLYTICKSIILPEEYALKHLVFCRREKEMMVPDLDMTNYLLSVSVFSKQKTCKRNIGDMCLNLAEALQLVTSSYGVYDSNHVLLAHTKQGDENAYRHNYLSDDIVKTIEKIDSSYQVWDQIRPSEKPVTKS